jgi:hypothetical protein
MSMPAIETSIMKLPSPCRQRSQKRGRSYNVPFHIRLLPGWQAALGYRCMMQSLCHTISPVNIVSPFVLKLPTFFRCILVLLSFYFTKRSAVDMATPQSPSCNVLPYGSLNGIYTLPAPRHGTILLPPTQEHMEDPYWYDMAGRDIIRQRHIFDRFEGGEQKEKLGEVLKEFPKKGGKIMETAAKEGFLGAMINFLELGLRPFGKVHDVDSKVESEGEVIEEEQKEGEDEDENADFVKYKIEDEDGNKVFWSLHLAAHSGQLECVQILVEKGNLDVDTLDDLITTPLINAVVQGNFEVSQWLLEKGADPEFKRRNEEGGLSILQAAAKTGKPELLKVILAHRNSNEDLVNLEHRLHVCAATSGNMEMLKLVLEKTGFPVDDDNTKGWKGASLKEKQRDEVELALGALNKESSVDFIGLLLSYLTPRNEDGSFQPHKLKDEGREISVLNGLEDSIHHQTFSTCSGELSWPHLSLILTRIRRQKPGIESGSIAASSLRVPKDLSKP